MKVKEYVIQSTYGCEYGHTSIFQSGIGLWTVTFDGTAAGLQEAFLSAQLNSSYVSEFNRIADEQGLPRYGRWIVFSIIDSFDVGETHA